jgi:hypothetical protein
MRIFFGPVKFIIASGKIIIPQQLVIDGTRWGEIFKKLLHG